MCHLCLGRACEPPYCFVSYFMCLSSWLCIDVYVCLGFFVCVSSGAPVWQDAYGEPVVQHPDCFGGSGEDCVRWKGSRDKLGTPHYTPLHDTLVASVSSKFSLNVPPTLSWNWSWVRGDRLRLVGVLPSVLPHWKKLQPSCSTSKPRTQENKKHGRGRTGELSWVGDWSAWVFYLCYSTNRIPGGPIL